MALAALAAPAGVEPTPEPGEGKRQLKGRMTPPPNRAPKQQSDSLKRMLGRKPRRG